MDNQRKIFIEQRVKDIEFYQRINMSNYAKQLIKDLEEKTNVNYYNMKGQNQ